MAKPKRVQRTSRKAANRNQDAVKAEVSTASETEDTTPTDPTDADTPAAAKADGKKAEEKKAGDKTPEAKKAEDKKTGDKKGAEAGKAGAEKSGSAEGANSAKRASRSGNPAKRAASRKTSSYTGDTNPAAQPNPRWFLPVMLGVLLLGLLWLIVFYISGAKWPVESWGNWNLLVGFSIMVVGLGMSTRWR